MAKLKNRNYKKQKASKSFEPMPDGKYPFKIETTEYKNNSANTGKFLTLTFVCIGKEYTGQKVFKNLNLENDSEQTENIAWSDYKAICETLGLKDFPKDTKSLHKKKLVLELTTTPGRTVGKGKKKKNYKARNSVKGYFPLKTKKGKKPWKE